MARATYVFRDGRLIDKREAPPVRRNRSHLAAPFIRSDGMADTWNPANGKTYDSKSAYERAVRDAGCQIVGNDPAISRAAPPPEVGGVEQDIKDAIDMLS